MNPSATAAAPRAAHDALDASPRVPTTYPTRSTSAIWDYLPVLLLLQLPTTYYLSFKWRRTAPKFKKHFLSPPWFAPATFLYLQDADLFPGGDPCGAFDLHSIDFHKIRPDEKLVSLSKPGSPTPEMTRLISRAMERSRTSCQ